MRFLTAGLSRHTGLNRVLDIGSSVAVLLIGAMFLWTGLVKLGNQGSTATAIHGYQLLPEAWTAVAALVLAGSEIILGGGLLLLGRHPIVALGALLLLTVFAVGQVSVLVRGIAADCGCFGAEESVSSVTLLRTTALMIVASVPLIYRWFAPQASGGG